VPTRRAFITAGGLALAGLAVSRALATSPVESGPLEIAMMSDTLGTAVWFDPIGVYVEPGRTVRWVVHSNVHTTTAYHPKNDHHSLRIPERAQPWDSRFLVNPGNHFEVTLTVPGVYDYFCAPHESAGMVGRIVVGRPAGPGALGFDYFRGRAGTETWALVPPAAQKAFPSVSAIMRHRVVRRASAPRDGGLGVIGT
jgi:plastocyanin